MQPQSRLVRATCLLEHFSFNKSATAVIMHLQAFLEREHEFKLVAVQTWTLEDVPTPSLAVCTCHSICSLCSFCRTCVHGFHDAGTSIHQVLVMTTEALLASLTSSPRQPASLVMPPAAESLYMQVLCTKWDDQSYKSHRCPPEEWDRRYTQFGIDKVWRCVLTFITQHIAGHVVKHMINSEAHPSNMIL